MGTQYSTDIPFSASHIQQPFKLLELPPDLLAALESENPPILSITTSNTTPSYALLTSTNPSTSTTQKYQMRQKNTSNPIMVLKSSRTGPTQADDSSTFIPQPSVTSVAKIEDTIELVLQEAEGMVKNAPKVNKWHEKFRESREGK